MSDRTITLTRNDVEHLRMGATVIADDSAAQPVDLSMRERERHNNPLVILTSASLDEIEREPDGLLVFKLPFGAEDSSYVIRMEAS